MDWKRIGRKLLFPPLWVILVLALLSAAGLIAVFLGGYTEHPAAYAVYVLAFYALSTLCLYCWKVLPRQIGQIKQALFDHKTIGKLLRDKPLQRLLGMYCSLLVSLLYALLNLVNWLRSGSWWFVVLTCFYTVMAFMRFLLVRHARRVGIGTDLPAEWKRARLCGYILLLVNVTLSGAVLMILYQDKGYDYPGMMIYVMAAYTFYATIHAIVEIVRKRHRGSPVMGAAKVVSLSAALISMLNLETAMFAQFGGDMAKNDRNLMIILTGAGISVVIVTLSLALTIQATKEIRRLKYGK